MPPIRTVDSIIAENKVVVFSKSFCPFCKKVKALFDELKVIYECLELDLMGDEGHILHQDLIKKTGQTSVPNIFINGKHIGGCDKTLALHADGTLQTMLDGTYREYDYDLVVLGGGSGGLAASKEAASLGKKVAVCDFVTPSPIGTTWGLGGTCVNVGCIPKKLMHTASLIGETLKDAPCFGWEVPENVKHDWARMVDEIQTYIKSLNFGYRKTLRENSVTYINAYAQFCDPSDPHKLKVTSKSKSYEITARKFLIAVGGRPKYPDIPGAKEFGITSDDIFSLPYCPGKTLIVGGSYIALECAGFLAGLGLDVTVMVRSILLRGFDQQMAKMIGDHMNKHGVKFLSECVPTSVERIEEGTPGLLRVSGKLKDGEVVSGNYNTVLFAVGREACTKNIGLAEIGVILNTDNGKVICDDEEKSSLDHVYAIGDVLDGRLELTPVAVEAGRNLAQRLYGGSTVRTDYSNVPTTVFTPLEYGCVGMSEDAAVALYGVDDIEVYHAHFQPLEFELSKRDNFISYAKLVCVKSEMERVVGFHVLGPNAGEITQGYALTLKLKATKSDFNRLIGIHPTCAEVFTTMNISKSSGAALQKTAC
ncbi:thioredoxin reductase 1, cytoplasmic [Anabrus simplex]|uniref:thioredoxin reductase 1, cytoplasmic n=1 Tax=Anabrus simplex TaxID=316456 RepID=UPI0035A36605